MDRDLTYAGIGSRQTPPRVLAEMMDLAARLDADGWAPATSSRRISISCRRPGPRNARPSQMSRTIGPRGRASVPLALPPGVPHERQPAPEAVAGHRRNRPVGVVGLGDEPGVDIRLEGHTAGRGVSLFPGGWCALVCASSVHDTGHAGDHRECVDVPEGRLTRPVFYD